MSYILEIAHIDMFVSIWVSLLVSY